MFFKKIKNQPKGINNTPWADTPRAEESAHSRRPLNKQGAELSTTLVKLHKPAILEIADLPPKGFLLKMFGPHLDQVWNKFRLSLDQVWTKSGPSLDQVWTKFRPSLDQV